KKLVIKAFKVKPKIPENFVENTWNRLERAVRAIHASTPVADSLEELYQACENLCYHKKADELYSKLRAVCDEHVQQEYTKIVTIPADGSVLHAVDVSWSSFCRQMILIRSIFLYLDRTYVLHTAGLRSLWDMGLDLYRERVMDGQLPVKKNVIDALLEQIKRERDGERIDHHMLRSHLRMFMDLSIYFTSFDPMFREASELYYTREGERLISELDNSGSGGDAVGRYLQHVDNRLAEEGARCAQGAGYIDVGSRKGLIATLESTLITKHVRTVVEKGFVDLVEKSRLSDLKRMYSQLSRVGALEQLRIAFASYIRVPGITLASDPARDASMVEDLLVFRDRISTIISQCFDDLDIFHNAMKESFEFFINQRQNRPAELIAKWVDAKLRTVKGQTDEELEIGLDKALVLFRYIQGKDVFEAFYKKDLAKRLLLQRSTSVDAEKSMLSKLKIECGPGFTSKLEGMFKDIDISRDYMSSFRESSKYTSQLGTIELSVNVLTHGYWPTYTPVNCNLPDELARCQEIFKEFYMSKHNGRRLTWQHMLGSGLLKCDFDKGRKELSVSLFQAVVLLLFNNAETLTYTDISKLTGLEEKELTRTLQSLCLTKTRILNITNRAVKTRDLLPDDVFAVNQDFENPLYRIKINQIQMKETVEEREQTEEGVFQDRQYSVDAAIVRIMKSRKSLSHVQLNAELMAAVKFNVKSQDFKKRIESLIDREYIERDSKDSNLYVYLA
ncbi:Cullin, partial [Powellomyces hirtus]